MSTSLVFDILARDRASTTFRNIGNTADRQTGKLRAFAKVGLMGLAAGGAAAAVGLVKATKAAAEDQAGQARLAAAARNTAKATDGQVKALESWIGAQGRSLGVTDDELRPAMGRLLTATGDIGEAQKLAALSMDVAAGSGKSLESVSNAVMKAQNGQVSALAKLGIETKDAEGNTLSFEQATAKMADTFGGQASTKAKTFQGTVDRLKLVFGETVEAIGAKLLPILTRMGEWFLAKGMPAISNMWGLLKDKLGPVLATVGDIIKTKVWPVLKDLAADALPKAKSAIDAVKQGFNDAKPFFELVGNIITNVLWPALKQLAKVALPLVVENLKNAGKFLGVLGEAGKQMWNEALQPVFAFLVAAVGKVLKFFGTMFQVIGKVPGMEWVGRLGDKLVAGAEKADALSKAIKDIPDKQTTTLTVVYQARGARGLANTGGVLNAFAQGTRSAPRGVALVGENGPELVEFRGGERVRTASETRRIASRGEGGGGMSEAQFERFMKRLESIQIRVTGVPAGQRAYLQTGMSGI